LINQGGKKLVLAAEGLARRSEYMRAVPSAGETFAMGAQAGIKVVFDQRIIGNRKGRIGMYQKNDIKNRCFGGRSEGAGWSNVPKRAGSGRHITEIRLDYPI
jgi:hypothetical protein